MAVYVGLGDLPGNVGLGVGVDVAKRYSSGVGVSDVLCRALGVRVFLEGPSGNI